MPRGSCYLFELLSMRDKIVPSLSQLACFGSMIPKACTSAGHIFIYLFIYVEGGAQLQPQPPSKPRIFNIRVRDLGFGMVLYLIVLNLNMF